MTTSKANSEQLADELGNQVTLSASSFEGRSTARQLTRECCRDLERITASSRVGAWAGILLTSFVVSFYGTAGPQGRAGGNVELV
jgi:hypothetical protein